MTYSLYSILDAKSKTFTEPFASANDATALRVFANQVNHNDLMKDNAKDFDMYRVGMFDNLTGIIANGKDFLASGKDVINE